MSATPAPVYDPAHYEKLVAVEDRHFWFRARNEVIEALAGQLTLGAGARVLELGCGSGNALRAIQAGCRGATVVGVDRYIEGLRHAQRRAKTPLVCADGADLPLRPGFELVCMFDVLEHIDDDVGAVKGVRSLLKPGGYLFVTVPAHMELWSYFDELSCHRRRYERDELGARLEQGGFAVEYATEFMGPLYPLMRLGRRRRSGARDAAADLRIYPGLNSLLLLLLRREARRIARRERLGRGTSVLALARAKE